MDEHIKPPTLAVGQGIAVTRAAEGVPSGEH